MEVDRLRERMVSDDLVARGITSTSVLDAMRRVPRHRFVPRDDLRAAYADRPLPIGHDQTISQPYIVALMAELLEVQPGDRVLDVGTGSGYAAAVLSELGGEIWSIERIPELAESAAAHLRDLGYERVHVVTGDGWCGWPDAAPYDAIGVAAAATEVPAALVDQLADGGRLVVPVDRSCDHQELVVVERRGDRISEREVLPVRFVPLVRDQET